MIVDTSRGRRLRVTLVAEYAYPVLGGISEHVHFLARELAALGHEVVVVTSRPRGTDEAAAARHDRIGLIEHGYETRRLGTSVRVRANGSIARMTTGVRLGRRLADLCKGSDVVHVHGLVSPTLPLLAIREAGDAATVGTFHTFLPRDHWAHVVLQRPLRDILDRLDRRVVVSEACIPSLQRRFPGRYEVVPNGVDCALFRPPGDDDPLPEGPPRILFVGRFDERNGLHTLLTAAARLAAEGRAFVVQVVGDGPARDRYRRQAERLGLAGRVEWLGPLLDGRPRRYRQATVFAAPCTTASFGVVLIEAMAAGAPIVCADNPGFRQVIAGGAPGRFVRPDDADDLARGLGALLDDGALRARWSAEGRRIALERYDWPTVAGRIDGIYEEVLASSLAAPRAPVARRLPAPALLPPRPATEGRA